MLVIVAPDSWVTVSTRTSPETLAVAVAQPETAFSVKSPSVPVTLQLILCSINWYSPEAPIVETFVIVLAPASK